MAGSMAIHQQANLTVTLNNEQAKRELEELQVEMKRLIDLRDKARKVDDLKAYLVSLAKRTAGKTTQPSKETPTVPDSGKGMG